jgi:hypothetical protein
MLYWGLLWRKAAIIASIRVDSFTVLPAWRFRVCGGEAALGAAS